jgi:hypothetical protein
MSKFFIATPWYRSVIWLLVAVQSFPANNPNRMHKRTANASLP